MAATVILSVRVSAETRKILDEAAAAHQSPGASALAREILEQWAADQQAEERRASIRRAVSYLRTEGEWSDEPSDFFRPPHS